MAINSLMDKTICPGSFLVNSLISPTSIIHYYRTKPTGWLDLGFSSGRSSWSSLHASSTRLVYITYHQLFRTSHWSKVQWQNTLHQTEQESLWVQTSCQKLVSLPRYRSEGERISPIKNNPLPLYALQLYHDCFYWWLFDLCSVTRYHKYVGQKFIRKLSPWRSRQCKWLPRNQNYKGSWENTITILGLIHRVSKLQTEIMLIVLQKLNI